MLQTIREHAQGWIAWVLVTIVAATFVFWGVGNYINLDDDSQYAARVNGDGILKSDLDRQVEHLRANHASDDAAALRKQALAQLIDNKLLFQTAQSVGFWVSDEQLHAMIMGIPAFQDKGKFSPSLYEMRLRSVGFTDTSFRNSLRNDLLVSQFQNGLGASLSVPQAQVDAVRALINESRVVQVLDIDTEAFRKVIHIPQEDLQKAYEAGKASFMTPEMVSIDYVVLNTNDLISTISVTEEDLKAYYDANVSEFTLPRQVHIAQILVATPKVDADHAFDKAKAKAESVLQQIKSGANFETLAKQNSDDPASAKVGGDIGWLNPGEMDPDFEKAAFALKTKNALSAVIKSQYGYHILKLIDEKAEKVQSFAEAKEMVSTRLKSDKAAELKSEKLDKMGSLAYEHSDSLQSLADELHLSIQTSKPFGRTGGDGIASKPKVAQAAFSDDVLQEGHNSDVIDIDDATSVVIRVNTHYKPEQKPFHVVMPDLLKQLEMSAMLTQAELQANKWIAALSAKQSIADELKAKKLAWENKTLTRDDASADRMLLNAVFTLPNFKSNAPLHYKGLALSNGHYAIVTVIGTQYHAPKDAKALAEERKQFSEGLTRSEAELEFAAILKSAKDKAKIEYL